MNRRTLRDTLYDELVSHATGTYTVTYDDDTTDTMEVTADDVNLINPEGWEEIPAVFYRPETTRHVRFNGAGNGPDVVERDSNGVVQYAQWDEWREDMFLLFVRAPSPAHREPVYDAIHRGFGKYDGGPVSEQDFHGDVREIRVENSNPSNSPDLEDAIWGDQLEVYIQYKRSYVIESGGSMTMDDAVDAVETISQVNLDVGADLDTGTSGFTYTVN